MYISSFSIENYKSYLKTDTIELKPGFNLFVGKNNVGKTSLLEALSTKLYNKPHLSEITVPRVGYSYKNNSNVNITISISRNFVDEFIESKKGYEEIFIPTVGFGTSGIQCINAVNAKLKESPDNVLLDITIEQGQIIRADLKDVNNLLPPKTANVGSLVVKYDRASGSFKIDDSRNVTYSSSIWVQIVTVLISNIYCFKAERITTGKCKFGHNEILKTNAENLPEVLNALQATPKKFNKLNKYLNHIFPEIHQIAIRPLINSELEILTWTIPPDSNRLDLAIPLSDSGTGVGQVLAMLYVILEETQQVVIIDELQSFLHPGAVRKLIEIFKENSHHQYLIATHSPTVISATNPETITLIQHEGSATTLKSIDKGESKELKSFLNDVGARLSDVFGADNILWVEGSTEEICVPMIIEKIMKHSLMGTNVVGIINSGDLEGRDKKRIYEIYNSLSKSNSLMPPCIGFLFDKEGKKENEIKELEKASNELVHFLPRRMYENYLLNSDAIAFVVNNIQGFSDITITKEIVDEWIEKNKSESKYWKGGLKYDKSKEWKKDIHAGEFFKRLFYDLSEHKVEYRKTEHSVRLTEWIIDNNKDDFKELTNVLFSILGSNKII